MSTQLNFELARAHHADLIRQAEATALVRRARIERRNARKNRRATAK